MRNLLKEFARDEEGATAIEYGLIASLISIAMLATLSPIGTQLRLKFGAILTALGGTFTP